MHAVGWGSTDPDNSQPAYSLQVCWTGYGIHWRADLGSGRSAENTGAQDVCPVSLTPLLGYTRNLSNSKAGLPDTQSTTSP